MADDLTVILVALLGGEALDLSVAAVGAQAKTLFVGMIERAPNASNADFVLVDQVAPSASPAWFVRRFHCGVVAICDPQADELADAARQTPIAAQRYALLVQAAAKIDDAQLFIPIAAPIRWSLVSERIQGFAGNRYARHTLTDLAQQPGTN